MVELSTLASSSRQPTGKETGRWREDERPSLPDLSFRWGGLRRQGSHVRSPQRSGAIGVGGQKKVEGVERASERVQVPQQSARARIISEPPFLILSTELSRP